MRKNLLFVLGLLLLNANVLAQPIAYHRVSSKHMIEIVKAEDELRFDRTLRRFLNHHNPYTQRRAALAAGRIGDANAIPDLIRLLRADTRKQTDEFKAVPRMAAFSLGEIESIEGADAILAALNYELSRYSSVRGEAIEAAGKIAAANPKYEKAKSLREAIIRSLEFEANRRSRPSKETILLGITAALRAKPEGADNTLVKFLGYADWRIRADALNALARLRAKNANDKARKLLKGDKHPIVRAKAARVLGAAGDKPSVDLLMKAAASDMDLRVRVNAIRALGALKDEKSADVLLGRAEKLLGEYKKSKAKNPVAKNELLTIVSALGNILQGTGNEWAVKLLRGFRLADFFRSSETEIAFVRIAPKQYLKTEPYDDKPDKLKGLQDKLDWQYSRSLSHGIAEFAKLPDEKAKLRGKALLLALLSVEFNDQATSNSNLEFPTFLRTLARFESTDFKSISAGLRTNHEVEKIVESVDPVLRDYVVYRNKASVEKPRWMIADKRKPGHYDPFVRSTAASLLGDRKASKENLEALKLAFKQSLKHDTHYDDAQLAILSALVKLDKDEAKESLNLALDHYAFLVRHQAAKLIKDNDLTTDFPNLKARVGTVRKYDPKTKSKLGQVTNSEADYKRAISRKNGYSKAVLKTDKGEFTINFFPEQAPLTVDNFIRLADSGYFNGLEIHRVVPNFVVQDGDPRGDGNGGPGWQIRCEINQIPYERGMVGMALSGKDTGGSQWFVTHAPQPHLDGGYTIFGKVNEKDMKVVDNLVRGDKILGVMIVEKYRE